MNKGKRIPGTFCEGCEYAGDVAFGAQLAWSSRAVEKDVSPTFVFDTQLNMSKGIVDTNNPEESPSKDRIIANCGRACVNGCSLDRAGLMAVEVDDDTKREAMLGLLNSYPGVDRLGKVIFTQEDGDGDVTYIYSGAPAVSLDN